MLKNPQGRLIRDAIAPTSAEVAELTQLYQRAVDQNRKFTPAEYDRVTELTNDLHRQYHYHYFMNFYPPVELKGLINRYHYGDGPRQWGLHMGRRAVTEARVAWARLHAETEASSESASPYPLEPLADMPIYQELRHRLETEATGPTAPPTPATWTPVQGDSTPPPPPSPPAEEDDNAMDTWVEPRHDDGPAESGSSVKEVPLGGTTSDDEGSGRMVDFSVDPASDAPITTETVQRRRARRSEAENLAFGNPGVKNSFLRPSKKQ